MTRPPVRKGANNVLEQRSAALRPRPGQTPSQGGGGPGRAGIRSAAGRADPGLRDPSPAGGGAVGHSATRARRPANEAQSRRAGAVRGEASPEGAAHQSLHERTHAFEGTDPARPPPPNYDGPAPSAERITYKVCRQTARASGVRCQPAEGRAVCPPLRWVIRSDLQHEHTPQDCPKWVGRVPFWECQGHGRGRAVHAGADVGRGVLCRR